MDSFKMNSFKKMAEKWMTRQRVHSLLTLALALLLLFQAGQYLELKEEMAFIDNLENSNSNVLQELSQGKAYLTSFGKDLNQIREFLLLPTQDYDFSELGEVDLASFEASDLTTLLFTYMEKLGSYEQNQSRYRENLAAFQTALQDSFWTEQGLEVNAEGNFSDEAVQFFFQDSGGKGASLLSVSLAYDGNFSVETFDGVLELADSESTESTLQDIHTFLIEELLYLRERMAQINTTRSFLSALLNSTAVQGVLEEKQLSLSAEFVSQEQIYYQLFNPDSLAVAEFSIAKEDGALTLRLLTPFSSDEDFFVLVEGDIEAEVVKILSESLDARTELEKRIEDQKNEIETLMQDKAFQALLENAGLRLGPSTELEDRIEYPILNGEGETVRELIIDKATGEVKVKREGEEAELISFAIQALDQYGKKKLSAPKFG